jgi:hypothetical protein
MKNVEQEPVESVPLMDIKKIEEFLSPILLETKVFS